MEISDFQVGAEACVSHYYKKGNILKYRKRVRMKLSTIAEPESIEDSAG